MRRSYPNIKRSKLYNPFPNSESLEKWTESNWRAFFKSIFGFKKKSMTDEITKESIIYNVASEHPETFEVFLSFGLQCAGCGMAKMETVEMGAAAHGIDPGELVKALNERVKGRKEELEKEED